ncbi:VWA domain-containing protein [Baekduia soli]|uniref:VWA domain-containing protein n=1 Tax=Baekduia soli TaxID=496014 RepID=A0A5B8UAH3_9ACTN|nr:VWA domain-containing protein [Baekduia soli]QEC50193.1 VWA domain-containing protein [Baekduia soli]
MAVPVALAAYVASRRRTTHYAMRFPATATLALAAGAVSPWRRHVPAGLALAALAALALALAKPQATVAVPIQGASIMLVTDHSASMSATDVDPDRLSAAKSAAETFLGKLPKATRVGVVTYSDGPDGNQGLTTDREPVRAAIEAQMASGATATGDALSVALGDLGPATARSGAKRPPSAIVLLSDGKTTTGSDPLEAARAAKRAGVPIYTVALGTDDATIPGPQGSFGPQIAVPPDPETLKAISEISGGRAFSTGDSGRLQDIYKELGSRLATKHEHREITAGFAAAGLVLLLAAGLTSLPRLGRLP